MFHFLFDCSGDLNEVLKIYASFNEVRQNVLINRFKKNLTNTVTEGHLYCNPLGQTKQYT